MKTILFLILIIGIQLKAENELRIAYFALPPHSSNTQGEMKNHGPLIVYFEKVLKELKVTNYKINELPLARLLSELESNNLDIGIYLAKNEERAKQFVFSNIPIYISESSLLTTKERAWPIEIDLNALSKLKICVWKQGYMSPLLKNKKIELIPISGKNIAHRCSQMIMHGRADAFYSPERKSVEFEMANSKFKNKLSIHLLKGEQTPLYTVFSKKAGIFWKQKVEQALIKVQSAEVYK